MIKSIDSHKTVKFILCVVHNSLLKKLQIFPMLNIFYTVQSNKIPLKDIGYQLIFRINTVVEINHCLMAVKHFYIPQSGYFSCYMAYRNRPRTQTISPVQRDEGGGGVFYLSLSFCSHFIHQLFDLIIFFYSCTQMAMINFSSGGSL